MSIASNPQHGEGFLSRAACERARLARDPRFDGRFFTAVRSTGIYCRPICPARLSKDADVEYFATAAAAQDSGYRACLRCRPEAAPGSAAWQGTSAVVSRALRQIEQGYLDGESVVHFAERFGLSVRQLDRLFKQHLGVTPTALLATRRLLFAKQLIVETAMPFKDVALAAGFGSVRQFNDRIAVVWQRSPRELRRTAAAAPAECVELDLKTRPPFDGRAILDWMRPRAFPEIEEVGDDYYLRRLTADGRQYVQIWPTDNGVKMRAYRVPADALLSVVTRVRKVFDLNADPYSVLRVLQRDELLKRLLKKFPGIRIPGAWNPWELAVRAILGQQVSVAAANTLAHRLVMEFRGTELFPAPAMLAHAKLETIGLPRARAEAIRTLAQAVQSGKVDFGNSEQLREQLLSLKGIGPWTADYIALRASGDPDAFPESDLALRKALATDEHLPSVREVASQASDWSPWRGYAAMLLWKSVGNTGG